MYPCAGQAQPQLPVILLRIEQYEEPGVMIYQYASLKVIQPWTYACYAYGNIISCSKLQLGEPEAQPSNDRKNDCDCKEPCEDGCRSTRPSMRCARCDLVGSRHVRGTLEMHDSYACQMIGQSRHDIFLDPAGSRGVAIRRSMVYAKANKIPICIATFISCTIVPDTKRD